MAGALSKRQQARNEKVLQDLVRSVPGNNQCADCHAANPAWASWSLGVFLCMRCAAIHRKLGTHISKVKSLSMDSWSNEQVDNMRKVGNVASNKIYNAENKKPPVPVDADEADSAMERFIRQKYMNNVAANPKFSKSTLEDEGTPPPLPPKNSTKFGFRSASSIFPLSSRSKKDARAPTGLELDRNGTSSHLANKPSKVFGATVDYDGPDDTEKKLVRLRDMGFLDAQRNAIVLKGVNGNIDRAVEALVRLGEGEKRSPGIVEPPRPLRTSRSFTPLTQGSSGLGIGMGLPQKTGQSPATPSSASTNPFDALPPAQPQTAQSTGSLQTKNPYSTSTNPYGAPSQQVDLISQAFQSLDVSSPQPPQPLFPNRTGGAASQQASQLMYQQQQQQFIPPVPPSPQVYQQLGFQSSPTFPQMAQQQPQVQTSYNPFLSSTTSSPVQLQPPQQQMALNTGQLQGGLSSNPFVRSPTRIASPTLGQIPEQFQATSFQSQSPGLMAGTNPFYSSPVQSPAQQNHNNPFSSQLPVQQQYYQQPQRPDTASIMALYGQTQPTQNYVPTSDFALPAQPSINTQNQPVASQSLPVSPVPGPPARSATLPMASGTNPFMSSAVAATAADPFSTDRKISRESMNLGYDMAWTNGRHSPDAFASLSARHV
ncbi:UBA domain-containing protein [Paramyrothecium foliicola]|nr:UBA domain-containing protein [Paramyrothecium foliicola]